MKWNELWNNFPTQYSETEFLRQIGNTVSGIPITQQQFNATIDDIKNGLVLRPNDVVLDLCCGNGIRTYEISRVTKLIVGIDISNYLIKIAQKYFKRENISYYCFSILDKRVLNISNIPFTKVLMYGALQYFDVRDLEKLLDIINVLTDKTAIIFIGSIPDLHRKSDFYNFNDRRKRFLENENNDQDSIGTWWEKSVLEEICQNIGYQTQVLPQSVQTESAYYRFDLRLKKTKHEFS